MARRQTIKRLSDLIPDILIEAQRCDEITAQKALERAVEDLAWNHHFFMTTQTLSVNEKTPKEMFNNVEYYVLYLDEMETNYVDKVAFINDDDSVSNIGGFLLDEGGKMLLTTRAVPKKEGRVRITYAMMPSVDADFDETAALTRGRRIIVALALYDLFSMTDQPWGNPDRAAFWMRAYTEALERWKYNDRFRGQTRGITIANNPFAV